MDPFRNQAYSGSMDSTVRIWDLNNGQCVHTLTGHTSLVGLISISPTRLVSASADTTVRSWDPDTGESQHVWAFQSDAVTCFQHDDFKVVSGAGKSLRIYHLHDGTFVRELLTDASIVGVWQVAFEGRWCVAAVDRSNTTSLEVWDFGRQGCDQDWIGEPVAGVYDDSVEIEEKSSDADGI